MSVPNTEAIKPTKEESNECSNEIAKCPRCGKPCSSNDWLGECSHCGYPDVYFDSIDCM